jgi:hypothetical protein
MVYTTLFPCGYVTFGDEAMRRYITLFLSSVYSSILNNRTSVRPLHRRNALALLLIQRPHCHFSSTPLHIVTNLPLPRKAMLHPGHVVAFFVVVSRMRAPTLSPRQRRFTRLHSVGQEIAQFKRLDQVRVPDERAVGDADVGVKGVFGGFEFCIAFGQRVVGAENGGCLLHGALHGVAEGGGGCASGGAEESVDFGDGGEADV